MFARAGKVIAISFVVIAGLLALVLLLKPAKYEAHMSFLVRNDRAEPLVSADPHQNAIQLGDVTEEQINSEVELLGSSELLQGVVRACGLYKEFNGGGVQATGASVEKATRKLGKNLVVTPVRKSNLITVAYASPDRERSVEVLNELAKEYLAKHLTLHTADTAASFFAAKSVDLQRQLDEAELRRADVLTRNGYEMLPVQKQGEVQQLIDAQRTIGEADASIAETDSRLSTVMAEQRMRQARVVTEEKSSANQYTVEQLNTLLANLENKRTDLAAKFLPGDRLLLEQDQEIADTKRALEAAQAMHADDTTTNVNPLRLALDGEADKLREQRAGLVSRRSNLSLQVARRRGEVGTMEHAEIGVDDLDRQIKELEETLLLYRSKTISAEITDDLDRAKISNVVIAESPIVPALPAPSPLNALTALLFAVFASLGIGFGYEVLKARSGMTLREVEA